jgi:hypothetical protein
LYFNWSNTFEIFNIFIHVKCDKLPYKEIYRILQLLKFKILHKFYNV